MKRCIGIGRYCERWKLWQSVQFPWYYWGDVAADSKPRSVWVSAGFPATLEIREDIENEFYSFQTGKTQEIWNCEHSLRFRRIIILRLWRVHVYFYSGVIESKFWFYHDRLSCCRAASVLPPWNSRCKIELIFGVMLQFNVVWCIRSRREIVLTIQSDNGKQGYKVGGKKYRRPKVVLPRGPCERYSSDWIRRRDQSWARSVDRLYLL